MIEITTLMLHSSIFLMAYIFKVYIFKREYNDITKSCHQVLKSAMISIYMAEYFIVLVFFWWEFYHIFIDIKDEKTPLGLI